MKRSRPSGGFKVARSSDTIYVQVEGLGTMNNSVTLEGFARRMAKRGYRKLVIDLGPCRGIDSTFMGLMLSLSSLLTELVIVNMNPHCLKQLRSVGLDCLLRIDEEPCHLPRGVVLADLASQAPTQSVRLKLIKRAHQELIRADARNERKFGAFLRDIVKHLGDDD